MAVLFLVLGAWVIARHAAAFSPARAVFAQQHDRLYLPQAWGGGALSPDCPGAFHHDVSHHPTCRMAIPVRASPGCGLLRGLPGPRRQTRATHRPLDGFMACCRRILALLRQLDGHLGAAGDGGVVVTTPLLGWRICR